MWKIAWRNIWRHKAKSLVIGVILFLGALLMTVGNGMIDGAKQGIEDNMINSLTGHLIVLSEHEQKDDVLFTQKTVEVIPNYQAIKPVLEQQDFIEAFLPLTRGNAMVLTDTPEPGYLFLLGVNFEDFQQVFPETLDVLEGDFLQPGERGVLVPSSTREMLFDFNGFWLIPENAALDEGHLTEDALAQQDDLTVKDHLIIMGFSGDGLESDIRARVKGIVKFKNLDAAWDGLAFIDLESSREAFGYVTAADSAVELTETQEAALELDDLDDLFGAGDMVETTETTEAAYDLEAMQQETVRADTDIDLDSGAYNMVTIKLQEGIALQEGKRMLQQAFAEAGVPAKVVDWKQAAGEVAQLATISQGALFIFVLFIFFVAAIIIMNTLSMTAIERVSELGMMRAIGARKAFVGRMFFAETALLAVFFGGLGMLIGVAAVWGIAAAGIDTTGNDVIGLLAGGDTLKPIITSAGVVLGFIQLAIVTVLAMLYPMRVATKITPLEAISRD